MKPTVQLQIDTPCHENWDAMTPVDHGRFCQACVKEVVDFSTMTDQQILYYLANEKGNICGRLSESQIQRPLIPATEQPKTKWWYALLMPLLMVVNKANAQQTPKQKKGEISVKPADTVIIAGYTTIKPVLPEATIVASEFSISGTVTDENGTPVAGAAITAKECNKEVVTNEYGSFNLYLKAKPDTLTLTASFIGYTAVTKKVTITNGLVHFSLQPEIANLQDVVVVAYPASVKGRISMGAVTQTISSTIIKDTLASVAKIIDKMMPVCGLYPNPVRRGQQLTLNAKDWDEFTAQVISATGDVLFTQHYAASKGNPQQIAVPSNWLPGIYYMRIVNEKNRKKYTEKFMVQ